jgi:preprotein translocase subunit YajC
MNNSKDSDNVGTIIGVIIVVIVLLVGAYYFYLKNVERQKNFQALLESAKQTATVNDGTIIYEEIVNNQKDANI